jgi:hypothetical protein
MIHDVLLDHFREAIAAGRCTLSAIARETGIPVQTLSDVCKRGWARGVLDKVGRIARALRQLDPAPPRRMAASFSAQPAFDASRPVREQIPDVERGLDMFDVPLDRLCRAAGITRRTWTNWRAGRHEPAYSDWVKTLEAAQALIEEALAEEANSSGEVAS